MLSPTTARAADRGPIEFSDQTRLALIGNSTAERMNLFGHLETRLHLRTTDKPITFRNFGWPADAVDYRNRPGNYTTIDDPFEVYRANQLFCFFGMNESFAGDDADQLDAFTKMYHALLDRQTKRLTDGGPDESIVLFSPIAFESSGDPLQPSGEIENRHLKSYRDAIERIANDRDLRFIDLYTPTRTWFDADPGLQYTINGVHLNQTGDAKLAETIETALFGDSIDPPQNFDRIRTAINDKSWLHLQDYRMLNGWYVYGGRRTWDTETFPTEFQKIRKMVAVRDQYVWNMAAGKPVPDHPDDSGTGEVFIPETMYGSRDEGFRAMREPKTLDYPTPDQTISQTRVPEGFELQCFASEKDFPELANPTQIAFDSKNRLWVSCMVNYPQWLPGSARPSDRLLILTDTDGDGVADDCKTFYDKLICPTGFEFYKDGVLVVDEPRILFLRDTDGDDVADEVTHLLDGIGTDDTHHAMGAWEYSPGGLLHMLEGIAMSTTLETPHGPKREEGSSGAYVWDLETLGMRHFRTPGHYNPWCLVFDNDGNGVIGDGTNANQHWTNLLSGGAVESRASVDAIFNNHGLRPAAGNEFLNSRQFPDDYHNRLVYACVINMHGLPTFEVRDDPDSSGLVGNRVDDFLVSDDMFFRPVDPKIGPDGALWFGDWCNALIGHMQYSQRDPNRDHQHGRIYRVVHTQTPLMQPLVLADASIDRLLGELTVPEHRTRYRVRRELRARDKTSVLAAVKRWANQSDDPEVWKEALWLQEGFHSVDDELVARVLDNADWKHRAAAIHVVGNQWQWMDTPNDLLRRGASDENARVRLEVARACSLQLTPESLAIALSIAVAPTDKWIDYVLQHTMQAMTPLMDDPATEGQLADLPKAQKDYLNRYRISMGPGADVVAPLKVLVNVDAKPDDQALAIQQVVAAPKGDADKGKVVFNRVCASCHMHGEMGKKFGPNLTGLGERMTKAHVIRSIVWPNEEIAKGYETVMILDWDGVATNGFILREDDDEITLGIADGKTKTIAKDDIEIRQEMKASSMPEGLTGTIAPGEFLDLVAFLTGDWVATNPNLDYVLQEQDGFIEVSRQSHVLLGPDFPEQLNDEAQHLLSHEGLRKNTYAIHTQNRPIDNPSVVIRMNQPTEVRRVKIFNRRDAKYHDRAKGLTFWISDDGENWTEVWHSEEAYPDWSFALPEGTVFRFAKLGLKRPGILHLDRVEMFGRIVQGTGQSLSMK